jgi:hypothetical protein
MSQAKFIQHPNGELALAVYDPVLGQMKEVSPDCLSFELGRLLAGSSSHSSPPSLEPVSQNPPTTLMFRTPRHLARSAPLFFQLRHSPQCQSRQSQVR